VNRSAERGFGSLEIDPLMPSARHGLSVLNTGELSEAAARAWRAARAGQLEAEDVSPRDYQVAEDLRGWTVLPVARIIHKHGDGQSGEFDGWYLGEEYHGGPHPILLLPPAMVSRKPEQGGRAVAGLGFTGAPAPGQARPQPGRQPTAGPVSGHPPAGHPRP